MKFIKQYLKLLPVAVLFLVITFICLTKTIDSLHIYGDGNLGLVFIVPGILITSIIISFTAAFNCTKTTICLVLLPIIGLAIFYQEAKINLFAIEAIIFHLGYYYYQKLVNSEKIKEQYLIAISTTISVIAILALAWYWQIM